MRTARFLNAPPLSFALSLALTGAGGQQRGKAAPTPGATTTTSNNSSQPLGEQDTEPFQLPGQDDTPLQVLARQERLRIEERQKHLAADTAKLVELSTRLQANVSRDGRNVLSLEDIRRTEEIEKLARRVRDRLKS